MPTVIVESEHSHDNITSYSVQKLISFYSQDAAERFADTVNNSDQGSSPDNTVKAIIIDATEQAVNGDHPHLLHMLHVQRSTGTIQYESVEVFTRRNLDFQRSVGTNPAIIHALDNPDVIAPAILTDTEREFHFLTEDRQKTTDVYLSFLPDIRERIQNIFSSAAG
jgi:hypothetical protein